jgi:hypothetical protein
MAAASDLRIMYKTSFWIESLETSNAWFPWQTINVLKKVWIVFMIEAGMIFDLVLFL